MRIKLGLILYLIFSLSSFAQSTIDPMDWYKGVSRDSIKRYKIFYENGDSSYVDTTLNIKKYFIHNLLRKDNIDLQRFANQGENYNYLTYREESSLNPGMGFRTKHINYYQIKDILYYNVPTPITELAYKTGYYRGQFLDAQFSANLKPNLNFSVSYKGLRSVGKYINSLSSNGNFRAGINYSTLDKNYIVRSHFSYQDLLNQESGGIEADSLFTQNSTDFIQRTAFKMNLTDAESFFKGKRFYINHSLSVPYAISRQGAKIFLQHIGAYETKYYKYTDNSSSNKYFFGSNPLDQTQTSDSTHFTVLNNDIYLGLRGRNSKSFLKFGLGSNYQNYSFGSLKVIHDNYVIPSGIKGGSLSAKAAMRIFPLGKLDINASAEYNFAGKFANTININGGANLRILNDGNLGANVNIASYYPEMQFWLYQSNYVQYNYYNSLEKQNRAEFKFYFNSKKIFDLEARYIIHNNYTYFEEGQKLVDIPVTNSLPINSVAPVRTVQYSSAIGIAEIMFHKDFRFGVFGFDTKTIFQKELSQSNIIRVPKIISRNTIYYSDYWFRKALELNTGVSVKYFSEFSSMQYNPLIASYYLPQKDLRIGDYPFINFFVNARIRTARIYFEIENIGAQFLDTKYFAAPHYPYADMTFRFGVVWNFFT